MITPPKMVPYWLVSRGMVTTRRARWRGVAIGGQRSVRAVGGWLLAVGQSTGSRVAADPSSRLAKSRENSQSAKKQRLRPHWAEPLGGERRRSSRAVVLRWG